MGGRGSGSERPFKTDSHSFKLGAEAATAPRPLLTLGYTEPCFPRFNRCLCTTRDIDKHPDVRAGARGVRGVHVAKGNGERSPPAGTALTPSPPEKHRVHGTSLSRAGPAPGDGPAAAQRARALSVPRGRGGEGGAGSAAGGAARPRPQARGRGRPGAGGSGRPPLTEGARPRPPTGVMGRRAGTRAGTGGPGRCGLRRAPQGDAS